MDDLFFYSSKLIWKLISPDSIFVFLLFTSLVLLVLNHKSKALILLTTLTLCTLFLSVFPVGSWLLYPLESRFVHNPLLPERIDGIIVLGGSVAPQVSLEWQQLETYSSHERLSSFIKLANLYPESRLLFTGGNASLTHQSPTEADMVKQYFIDSGIGSERLVLENKARNTAENVTLAKQLLSPESDQNWILITTAYHMPRSVGIFCKQGWPVIPYPVDHQTAPSQMYQAGFNLLDHANDLVTASHEWTGLLAYYLAAKTTSLVPSSC
jgi:uncharacterized SAM-binding protein YcdF (DUF218 family)